MQINQAPNPQLVAGRGKIRGQNCTSRLSRTAIYTLGMHQLSTANQKNYTQWY